MSKSFTAKHSLGALVAEGKTKKIHLLDGRPGLATIVSKDDITAGDGAKHDIIPDKGRLANATTCNVFRLLKACGLPVAFVEQDSAISFVAPKCDMLPYEVVVRREAHGSYLKRNPHLAKGQLFPQAIVEFYLKTKDKNWKGKPLVADDPFMQLSDDAKADPAVQSGQAVAGAGAVPGAAGFGSVRPRRGVEDFSRDAAHRPSNVFGAGKGLAARRRNAGRSQGRVRFRFQRQSAARRRHRQRFLARGRERLLYRQAGLSRWRRAR